MCIYAVWSTYHKAVYITVILHVSVCVTCMPAKVLMTYWHIYCPHPIYIVFLSSFCTSQHTPLHKATIFTVFQRQNYGGNSILNASKHIHIHTCICLNVVIVLGLFDSHLTGVVYMHLSQSLTLHGAFTIYMLHLPQAFYWEFNNQMISFI